MGNTLLSQLMAKSTVMDNSEKNEMKEKARAILGDMESFAGDSELLSGALSKAKGFLDKAKTAGDGSEDLTALKTKGLSIVSQIHSPEQIKEALETNPEFVTQVKQLGTPDSNPRQSIRARHHRTVGAELTAGTARSYELRRRGGHDGKDPGDQRQQGLGHIPHHRYKNQEVAHWGRIA
jgi:hypothetical protein